MKINLEITDIYLEEINMIIGRIITQQNVEGNRLDRNLSKYKDFLKKNGSKDMDIYEFELGDVEEIKRKFGKMIKIEIPTVEEKKEEVKAVVNPERRKKAQSMEPMLRVLSPMKQSKGRRDPRYSIN